MKNILIYHSGLSVLVKYILGMRGISEMHLSVQTARICKKVFMKRQNISKYFCEICFWMRKMNSTIEIFI